MESSLPLSESAAIAGRIRGLIAGQDGDDLASVARRLRVGELALRMSIDSIAPQPALTVVLAVVREYGVDPSWLMTGTYDSETHRIAIESPEVGLGSAIQRSARPLSRLQS